MISFIWCCFMETVGSFLKTEREKQQKSLSEVANATRIGKSTLAALEDGKGDFLPPQSYVRGFLRIYASELGLDPDEVIQMYDTELLDCGKWEPQKELKGQAPPVITRSTVFAGLALVCIAVLLYCAYYFSSMDTSSPDAGPAVEPVSVTQNAEVPPEPTAVERAEVPPHKGQQSVSTPAPVVQESDTEVKATEEKKFMVKFVASELTWIRIEVNDSEPFEIMLREGESYRKSASESMRVRIGNAGGIRLFYNDIPIDIPGNEGQPVNLTFPDAAKNTDSSFGLQDF